MEKNESQHANDHKGKKNRKKRLNRHDFEDEILEEIEIYNEIEVLKDKISNINKHFFGQES